MNYIDIELARQKKFWTLLTMEREGVHQTVEQPENGSQSKEMEDRLSAPGEQTMHQTAPERVDGRALSTLPSGRSYRVGMPENVPEAQTADASDSLTAWASAFSLRQSAGELSACVERDARRYDGAYSLY